MSTKTEMTVCTCGREAEAPWEIGLKDCTICDKPSCEACRHECAECGVAGCEKCMVSFQANRLTTLWFCPEDCRAACVDPYGLFRRGNEDKKNMAAALRQFLPPIEAVTTFDLTGERERDDALTGLRNAGKLYLSVKGDL